MKKLILILVLLIAVTCLGAKTNKIIQAFNAGALSPKMNSRHDQEKYQMGCRTLQNFYPMIYGGAERRPGTEYVADCKSSSAKSRLMAFEHSVDDTYILEFANQVIRVFKDGDIVYSVLGTEDLSSASNVIAHWKMNDTAETTAVVDAEGATYNGVLYGGDKATAAASTATDTDGADGTNRSFDMSQLAAASGAVQVSDAAAFSFGDGSDDSAFSLHAWVKYTDNGLRQDIITKTLEGAHEWELYVNTDDKVVFGLRDESASGCASYTTSDTALAEDAWTFVVGTYNGQGGNTAAGGLNLYIDRSLDESVDTNNAVYDAMEDGAADLYIGGANGLTQTVVSGSKGGVLGTLTGGGGLVAAFDGDESEAANVCAYANLAGKIGYVGKDWGENNARVITGMKAWGSNNNGFVEGCNPTVTVSLEGSSDNSTWVDLSCVSSITDLTAITKAENLSCASTTAYRYHRLKILHNDAGTRYTEVAEIEFYTTGGPTWKGKIDNVAVFDKELTANEVSALASTDTTTPLEITTPYLTADLFEIKSEHSADVLYLTHPDYQPRKLSRLSDASWTLALLGIENGPFRDENDNTEFTIQPSGTTGDITLTATGGSPFVDGTTAGHEPSGALNTSKSKTGALFRLSHPTDTPSIVQNLDSNVLNDATDTIKVNRGVTWDFVTNGTWGAGGGGPSSIVLERSYDEGTTYETVHTVTSLANKNVSTSDKEEVADAIYRARVSDAGGTGTANIHISIRETSVDGVVKITSVDSTTVANATVLATLASASSTHQWAEGAWSNYRGWPISVSISPEERLVFCGSTSKPLTVWGSGIGDFENFEEGVLDDDAIVFTLVGSGRQNRIRWVTPKTALAIGTVGGEHILGASKEDEALTPTNVQARVQTSYGSADIQAISIGRAILFVQRGGRKVREMVYDFDSDSHKAEDLTVFADHITASTVVDMAFQRTPDPILWCVRNDGDMAILSYERDQNIFAWAEYVTSDSTGDANFESVAVIYGGKGKEDEVWVSVERVINGSQVRYIERFKPRDWGADLEDACFVDCGVTYDSTTASSVISDLSHLEGETVHVFADGLLFSASTVDGGLVGVVSSSTDALTEVNVVHIGIPYYSTIKPMKLDLGGLGLAPQKKVTEGTLSFYQTIGGDYGTSTSNMYPINYSAEGESTTELFTGDITMPFDGGYTRQGDVIIIQDEPLPMTLLSLTLDIGAHNY